MQIFYSDHFTMPLPDGHRFPMPKYMLLGQRVRQAGLVPPEDLHEAPAAGDEDILRVHLPEYWDRVVNGTLSEKEIRRIGFPWSPGLVERTRRSVGGDDCGLPRRARRSARCRQPGGRHASRLPGSRRRLLRASMTSHRRAGHAGRRPGPAGW